MTVSARTVETNFADALAQLLTYIGDTDNAAHWMSEFENSLPSPIVRVQDLHQAYFPRVGLRVTGEDGSVLHLTVTQIKEPNQ